MAEISLDLVRQKLEEKMQMYDNWSVTVTGDSISISCRGTAWSPNSYSGEDELAGLVAAGLLFNAWVTHRQYLAGLFGEPMVGARAP